MTMKLKLVFCVAFATTIISAKAAPSAAVTNSRADGARENAAIVTSTSSSRNAIENDADENIEKKSFSQKLLVSQDDLKEYVSKQMHRVYEMLREFAKNGDSLKTLSMDVDQVPPIADAFYVGKFNKTYKLADMQYTNVRVYGMSAFNEYTIAVDQNFRKAEITLVANQLRIEGNYSLSNFLKHASGSFVVKLLDNVTYTENDLYCKFKNEIDIASSEVTTTYGKSEYDYRNMGVISVFFEGVVSGKLVEEVMPRVGKELGHRMRHVVVSKIKQITSQRDATTLDKYNRITSIVQSSFSQIRTWLNKNTTIGVFLPRRYHNIKVYNNKTIAISNITLTGLNTMHLSEQINVYRENYDFSIEIRGEAGPLIIGGETVMTEAQSGMLVQVSTSVQYQVSSVRVRMVVSKSLSEEDDPLQVGDLQVSVSQPSLKMQPNKIGFEREELKQLAEFLKPGVEAALYKWLKDFANDTFKPVDLSEGEEKYYS